MARGDVVIVGGGTSGAVLAARLSEDPARSVLLLEAGPDDSTYPDVVRVPEREYDAILSAAVGVQWGVPVGAASSPTLFYRGEVLGGTSAVNFMATVRGQPDDYDGWAAAGCDGWGWDDVLPAMRRAETDRDFGHQALHGDTGPLTVQRWPEETWAACHRALYDGALELGVRPVDDINDPMQVPGVGVFPGSVQGSGERLSVSQAYLDAEVRARANLTVRCEAPVARVVLDGGRAVGVELRSGEVIEAAEVILCAGAIESPKLLLLSGIGPAGDLRALNIDPVLDLPGVGANLQDHVGLGCIYHRPEAETLVGSPAKTVLVGDTGRGRGVDFHVLACPISSSEAGGTLFQVFVFHLLPRSRGRLTLASADPAAVPALDLPLLDGDDLEDLATVVELVGRWEQTAAFAAIGASRLSPVGDLVAGSASRDGMRALLDSSTYTYFHQVGTCAMGPADDPDAVLDPHLRVRGVDGLRVADASAMPTIVRGNTYLGCVMLAERLAELMA